MSVPEFKSHCPVAVHPHRPAAARQTGQRMQAESRNIHIINGLRGIQCCQQHSQPFAVVGLNTGCAACCKEFLQPLVPERLDHGPIIACCASRNNDWSFLLELASSVGKILNVWTQRCVRWSAELGIVCSAMVARVAQATGLAATDVTARPSPHPCFVRCSRLSWPCSSM